MASSTSPRSRRSRLLTTSRMGRTSRRRTTSDLRTLKERRCTSAPWGRSSNSRSSKPSKASSSLLHGGKMPVDDEVEQPPQQKADAVAGQIRRAVPAGHHPLDVEPRGLADGGEGRGGGGG